MGDDPAWVVERVARRFDPINGGIRSPSRSIALANPAPTRWIDDIVGRTTRPQGRNRVRGLDVGVTQGLGYQCLGRDVQVFDLGRTIGALDLVLRSPKGQIEHWELAYKVYLQAQAYAEWEHWVGPGQRDRLDRKVRRMLDHQVPLSTHPASHAALQSLGVAQIDARRVMLQGVLFRPWGEPASWAEDAPHEAKGRWFRPSQLESVLQANPGGQWWQRMKPHWFGPWGFNEKEGLSADSFRIRCQTTPVTRPEMWTTTSKSGADDGDVFFLVPETWGA